MGRLGASRSDIDEGVVNIRHVKKTRLAHFGVVVVVKIDVVGLKKGREEGYVKERRIEAAVGDVGEAVQAVAACHVEADQHCA
jgi:hypothetical protein